MALASKKENRQLSARQQFSLRATWNGHFIALLSLMLLQLPVSAFAAIMAAVESPEAGPVAGVQIVRGWAFETTPEVAIARVDLFIDNTGPFAIPCCGERADVAAAFPQYPPAATLQSGWGMTFNWGILPPGTHAVRVEIHNTQGEVWTSPTRQVEVISLGGFEFVEELSLAQATVRLEGQDIILEGVRVQDKATGAEQVFTLRLRWDTSAQTLVVSEATPSEAIASLMLQRLLQKLTTPLRAWFVRAVSAGAAQAGEGIRAEWESPAEGQIVAGVGVVRAWMFAEEAGVPIADVQLLLDGQPVTTLPCCSARADVAAAFPDNPNAEQSGAGLVINYGEVDAGPHTLELVITAANGARCTFARNIIVIQPGGFAFLDLFDLSQANVRIEGEELVIHHVLVREKASQLQRTVVSRFRWENHGQGFVLASNSPPEAVDQTTQVRKGQDSTLTVVATDADGDSLTYEIVDEPKQGRLSGTPPHLTYSPLPEFTGQDQFTFQARDFTSASNTATITLTLNTTNRPPNFTAGPNQTVLEDAGPRTVAGWATGMDDGDPGVTQALTFVATGNTNPGLFAAGPSVDATTGTLTYTPAANANGNATITLVLRDNGGAAGGGQDTSIPRTFTITVAPVNDAPSFTVGPDQAVSFNAGPQTVSPWATDLSAGPTDEIAQSVTFQITRNTNPSLFSVTPAISATGILTYTPAPNVVGSASVTVTLSDDGGVADDGEDTSAPQTFTITVAPNAPPNFTAGPNQTVLEDAGPRTVAGWATGMDDGDPGVVQTLTFQVTGNTNPGLFTTEPAVDATTGTLTYTPAANANGSATITLVLQDDGGVMGGGQDTSTPQTFTITITPVNDAPSFAASNPPVLNGNSGRQEIVVGWAAFTPGPGDENSQTATYSVSNVSNAVMFDVPPAVAANGTLIYTPNQAGTATFDVIVRDNGGTSNGGVDTSAAQTFTITVNP